MSYIDRDSGFREILFRTPNKKKERFVVRVNLFRIFTVSQLNNIIMKKRTFYTSIIILLVSGLYLVGFGMYGVSKLTYNNDMYVIILLGVLVFTFGITSYMENKNRVF